MQAAFACGGHIYFVVHSYARAPLTLINTVPGITATKTCPRIAGSTLGGAAALAHLIVIVAEHVGWKVHPHTLHNNGRYPTAPLGYPFVGHQRVLLQSHPDPSHP